MNKLKISIVGPANVKVIIPHRAFAKLRQRPGRRRGGKTVRLYGEIPLSTLTFRFPVFPAILQNKTSNPDWY